MTTQEALLSDFVRFNNENYGTYPRCRAVRSAFISLPAVSWSWKGKESQGVMLYHAISHRPLRAARHGRLPLIFLRLIQGVGVVLSTFLIASQTWAQTEISGPFDALGAKWVTFEQFETQLEQQDSASGVTIVVDQPAVSPPAAQTAKSALAEPERPLNLASMPTFSSRYALGVSSTSDVEDALSWIKEAERWRSLEAMDRDEAEQRAAENLIRVLGRDPFRVRFASLPSDSVKSIPAEPISTSVVDREAATERARKEAAMKKEALLKKVDVVQQKETNKACEAFADYRRRQLQAMESDRETLSALQAALASLGAANELSFAPRNDSALSEQAAVAP